MKKIYKKLALVLAVLSLFTILFSGCANKPLSEEIVAKKVEKNIDEYQKLEEKSVLIREKDNVARATVTNRYNSMSYVFVNQKGKVEKLAFSDELEQKLNEHYVRLFEHLFSEYKVFTEVVVTDVFKTKLTEKSTVEDVLNDEYAFVKCTIYIEPNNEERADKDIIRKILADTKTYLNLEVVNDLSFVECDDTGMGEKIVPYYENVEVKDFER